MNGSRSNTPHGGKPSLDQLNRTIEGLEARIQGLMGERQRPAAAVGAPIDAIIERQRTLGSTRERVASAIERPRVESPRTDAYRSEPRHVAAPMASPEPAWERPQFRASSTIDA